VACDDLLPSPTATPSPSGPHEFRPEAVGVISSIRLVENRVLDITTREGTTVRLRVDEDRRLRDAQPQVGGLMFTGGTADSRWFFAVPDYNDPNCYIVEGSATETIEELHFSFGLVLQKADDFDRGSGNFNNPAGSQFCVNERGEVLRLRE
jgi:hypothetical protein